MPPPIRRSIIPIPRNQCITISQCRSFRALHPQNEKQSQQPLPPPYRPSALEGAPRSYGRKVQEFTPKALDRPIGLGSPPQAGENSGKDRRTWRQIWEGFWDRERHEAKHKKLIQELARPYFRDLTNIRKHHDGKSFLSPPRVFKSERALYFPNLYGQTLLKTNKFQDTTPLLENKVSIVSIYSNQWAENQANSLVAQKNNPDLHDTVNENTDVAQFVKVNRETHGLKAWIIRRFLGGLRKQVGEENWGRYFLVTRDLERDINDAIGFLNNKVGYTYLVDGECKIRWACSGQANAEEKAGIVKGVKLLIREAQRRKEETEGISCKKQAEAERALLKNTEAAASVAA